MLTMALASPASDGTVEVTWVLHDLEVESCW
jgi:hypothetical protein